MSPKNLNAIKIPKVLKEKLYNKKALRLFNIFEKDFDIYDSFVVAVSGGPDSLALAFLTKIYSIKNKVDCKYFIVDHKLRKESTEEAKKVRKVLDNFNIKSKILTWKGKKPKTNIQSLARKKRYDLLFSQCKKLRINNLVVGHHLDDLFENFFIRMIRGSGLKGLVSLEKKTMVNKINLLRFLPFSIKQESHKLFWGYTDKSIKEIINYEQTLSNKYILGINDCRHYTRNLANWTTNKPSPIWKITDLL